MMPGAYHDIVVYAHREHVGFLKDHAYFSPERNNVSIPAINRGVIEQYFPLYPGARDQIIHPVENTEKRRFAAS
jgi:hypothetical protein